MCVKKLGRSNQEAKAKDAVPNRIVSMSQEAELLHVLTDGRDRFTQLNLSDCELG